jgi:hypothetical protein
MKREAKCTHTSWRKERSAQSKEDEERRKGYTHILEERERRPIRGQREK